MEEWIKFNFNEHDSEEDYIFSQEKIITRQNETKVTLAMERDMDDAWSQAKERNRKFPAAPIKGCVENRKQ